MRDADNASLHGVSITTVRRWRRVHARQAHTISTPSRLACPRCDTGHLDRSAYVELLGWYLGDGHITLSRRGVFVLCITNDARYPRDAARIAALMTRVKPGSSPTTRARPGAVVISAGWRHWPCVFPQHGPGRKHERRIQLQSWQQELVDLDPAGLLRGLMHADGSRVRNWASRTVNGETKRYDYPRWQLVNRSEDILGIACRCFDILDVAWRRSGAHTVSVSTRAAVAGLDRLIGLKT